MKSFLNGRGRCQVKVHGVHNIQNTFDDDKDRGGEDDVQPDFVANLYSEDIYQF